MNGWGDDGECGRRTSHDRRGSGKSGRMVERLVHRTMESRIIRRVSTKRDATSSLPKEAWSSHNLEQVGFSFLVISISCSFI